MLLAGPRDVPQVPHSNRGTKILCTVVSMITIYDYAITHRKSVVDQMSSMIAEYAEFAKLNMLTFTHFLRHLEHTPATPELFQPENKLNKPII